MRTLPKRSAVFFRPSRSPFMDQKSASRLSRITESSTSTLRECQHEQREYTRRSFTELHHPSVSQMGFQSKIPTSLLLIGRILPYAHAGETPDNAKVEVVVDGLFQMKAVAGSSTSVFLQHLLSAMKDHGSAFFNSRDLFKLSVAETITKTKRRHL